MAYKIHATLIDDRDKAIRATIEAFLWADGANSPEEIASIVSKPDEAGDQDTALNLAAELISGFGGELPTTADDEIEQVDRIEWAAAIRQIVGVKYADPIEDARLIWDECDARAIEREDDSLVARSQWHPRDNNESNP